MQLSIATLNMLAAHGDEAAQETVDVAEQYFERFGKSPIVATNNNAVSFTIILCANNQREYLARK